MLYIEVKHSLTSNILSGELKNTMTKRDDTLILAHMEDGVEIKGAIANIEIGYNSKVRSGTKLIVRWGKLRIGQNTIIGENCIILDDVTIGNDCLISPGVMIFPNQHNFDRCDVSIINQEVDREPIVIEDNCYIGSGAIILKGVRIGTGSVIGAGSVVVGSIPPNSIAVGSPAKIIRKREVLKVDKLSKYEFNPLSYMSHYRVSMLISENYPSTDSIIDVGGVGESFLEFIPVSRYVDANLTVGIDGTNLPFGDNEFDIGVSMYTLEHVPIAGRVKLVGELVRVSKLGCFIALPTGNFGRIVEDIKKRIGYQHAIVDDVLPSLLDITNYLDTLPFEYEVLPDADPITHILTILSMPMLDNHIRDVLNRAYGSKYFMKDMEVDDAYSVIVWVKKSGK